MFRERFNTYYPQVIQSIEEFKAIANAEYPEFEDMEQAKNRVTDDAYLVTMSEERIAQWEHILGIVPIGGSSVEDRRGTVTARIRGQGKLNTDTINRIVNAFTGGTATAWLADSVLHVEVTPPKDNRQYLFANIEQELRNKTPAHLGLNVYRNYYLWGEAKADFATWADLKEAFDTWEDVLLYIAE